MEFLLALGVLSVIVLLGFAALILLKSKIDKDILKDLLKMQIQIQKTMQKSEQIIEVLALHANKAEERSEKIIEVLESVQTEASSARVAAEAILKEYELNGVPLGYERNFDAIEGV